MQLVKNAFESGKNRFAKLEEILVYILENNRIVSKERMLEVYFNIIEWGPNVWNRRSKSVLFSKTPSELSLNECLYSPNYSKSKKFMYQFNDQLLKDFAKTRDFLTNIMFRRGLLTLKIPYILPYLY
jgi:membrane carboxypeptidase/penicillin-binding protein PbpC